MAPRLKLQELLEQITPNVYFQPPTNIQLKYPCITYHRDYRKTEFANNQPYNSDIRYQVTVIDRDPDSEIPDMVANLPKCLFTRFFTSDDLNHDVFNLYF